MTRKDFRELAEALGNHGYEHDDVIAVVIRVCQRNNKNFDITKFRAAIHAASNKPPQKP